MKDQQKQHLVDMMKSDQELGLYEQETKELNPYIGPFLLRNGFIKHKIRPHVYKDNIYHNSKCTINVLEDCYEIQFDEPEVGEVTMFTDSWSIPHLVGTLTWNDLIDRNYIK